MPSGAGLAGDFWAEATPSHLGAYALHLLCAPRGAKGACFAGAQHISADGLRLELQLRPPRGSHFFLWGLLLACCHAGLGAAAAQQALACGLAPACAAAEAYSAQWCALRYHAACAALYAVLALVAGVFWVRWWCTRSATRETSAEVQPLAILGSALEGGGGGGGGSRLAASLPSTPQRARLSTRSLRSLLPAYSRELVGGGAGGEGSGSLAQAGAPAASDSGLEAFQRARLLRMLANLSAFFSRGLGIPVTVTELHAVEGPVAMRQYVILLGSRAAMEEWDARLHGQWPLDQTLLVVPPPSEVLAWPPNLSDIMSIVTGPVAGLAVSQTTGGCAGDRGKEGGQCAAAPAGAG